MSTFSIVLAVISTIAMLLFITPNVIAMNRGHILRNIALWLAIFVALAGIYKIFHPTEGPGVGRHILGPRFGGLPDR
jgi:hypothetical protein